MYQSRVFLEVRILLSTTEKAFCSCHIGSTARTCPICRREAGSIPTINPQAARRAYTLAQALDCVLTDKAAYERPKGSPSLPDQYRLSGASIKIAGDGTMGIEFHRRKKQISIQDVRIEEDAGRLTHLNDETRMDYSQAGAPSIRIRTGPEFELGEEVEIFLTELRRRIQYMGILKGVPLESVIRCNAYVSLARYPLNPEYTVKLRNLNSFNFARKAINVELHRQEEILTSGGNVDSESRIWNERQNRTEFHQNRESVSAVLTTPLEGNPIFICPQSLLAELRASTIEHPSNRQNRLIATWGITRSRAEFICDEKSRADFYEETIRAGSDPMDAAHWLMSDVTGLLRKTSMKIQSSPLSPLRFASILGLYRTHTINSRMAKQLLQAVLETDKDPVTLMEENDWVQITDPAQLRLMVQKIIVDNPQEASRLREGDMAPLEFLTGLIMKKTRGLAEPGTVKILLKEELKISLIYILAMGGTITGSIDNGEITGGDAKVLKTMLDPEHTDGHVLIESVVPDRLLSEEIQPSDWAELINAISQKIASGTANGIVVTHGTDTLAYTAPLIYWLFADSPVPIVFTASNTPPAAQEKDSQPDEARRNLNQAINLATEKEKGIYVAFGDRVLSPINLKFLRPALYGFTNWNTQDQHIGAGLLTGQGETDTYVMGRLLSEAADRMHLIQVYPGLRADRLLTLTDTGVTHFFLELYEKGTGNMKNSDYSLKQLLIQGRRRGCKFYCTSQQEGVVDFSGYTTSRRMWREGAIPMGMLTTETAIALYFAASLVCDNLDEIDQIMETAGQN